MYRLLLFSFLTFLTFSGCAPSAKPPVAVAPATPPQRLISTAPSITEILFDIGIGDRIVGDSRYTAYPPEAKEIEKICGMYDGDWEKIIGLEPDLVLILKKNEYCGLQCQESGIESLVFDHGSMEGVLKSYDLIGQRFGPEVMQAAQARKAALEEKLSLLRSKGESLPPVRVLICIDRIHDSGQIQNLYAAGTSPYFQDIIRWAGGINAAESTGLAFPCLSVEDAAAMNPDVIIDLMISEVANLSANPSEEKPEKKEDDLIADWKILGNEVNAVKTGRIFVLMESYATIPGPRAPLLVEKLIEILHGEQAKQIPNDFDTSQKADGAMGDYD